MTKARYQAVLRRAVWAEQMIYRELRGVLEARLPDLGELDLDESRRWVAVEYFTRYAADGRHVAGFTIDFSELDGFSDLKRLMHSVGEALRDHPDTETLLRYDDDLMQGKAIELHREVWEIEMKLRETINYILSFNLPGREMGNMIGEFKDIQIANDNMRKNEPHRLKTFRDNFENELFYILFNQYGYFREPITTKPDEVVKILSQARDFEEFKSKVILRGITDQLNPNHVWFVHEISSFLNPLEKLRNEIMHNRALKEEQITGFGEAKEKFEKAYADFWREERGQSANQVSDFRQALEALNLIFRTLSKDDSGKFSFQDFDLIEVQADTEAEAIEKIGDLIQYNFQLGEPHFGLLQIAIRQRLTDEGH